MSEVARSTRLPWLRGGLTALVLPLLPLIWVSEASSCGGGPITHKDITGLEVLGHVDGEGWLVLINAFLISGLMPPLARFTKSLGGRMGLHLLGLAAAVLSLLAMDFTMTFSIFTDRTLRPGGLAVSLLLGAGVLDALARFVLSIREWRAAAKLTSSASTAPRTNASASP